MKFLGGMFFSLPICFSYPNSISSDFSLSSSCEDYALLRKIGRGKYSEVYEGICRRNGSRCSIKILKPIKLKKLQRYAHRLPFDGHREVRILTDLAGGPGVVPVFSNRLAFDSYSCWMSARTTTLVLSVSFIR